MCLTQVQQVSLMSTSDRHRWLCKQIICILVRVVLSDSNGRYLVCRFRCPPNYDLQCINMSELSIPYPHYDVRYLSHQVTLNVTFIYRIACDAFDPVRKI